MDSVDSLKDLAEHLGKKFVVTQDDQDELLLRENPDSATGIEIRVAPRKIFFGMNACRDYHQFIKALETNIKVISEQIIPKEVLSIGVQGCYLYPITSFQEFSQLAFSWTGNYISSHSMMEINDLGATVHFREGSLKVNLTCKIMTQDQIGDFFPDASIDTVAKLNLFINVEIATDEAVKMNSVASHSIGQAIKEQVHHATHLIEERLGKEINIDSSSSVS
jgi:hypothetical protein